MGSLVTSTPEEKKEKKKRVSAFFHFSPFTSFSLSSSPTELGEKRKKEKLLLLTGKDRRRLRDPRKPLRQQVRRQMVQVQVHVVLFGAAASPLPDLQSHRTRDNVAGSQVFQVGSVALHEPLPLPVTQDPALAAAPLGDQAPCPVDSSRVELDELEVLEGQPGARSHGTAIASAGVRRSGRKVGAAVASRGEHGLMGSEAVEGA